MKKTVLFLILIFIASHAFSLEFWPLKDPELRRVFLQSTSTGLLTGTELSGSSEDVLSPDKGEVLLISQPGAKKLQNIPSALGGFVILAHEGNLRTAVAQFKPSAFIATKTTIQGGERMGGVLDPSSPRVRLFVFDQQLATVVNPQMVLPSIEDTRQPLLFDAMLTSEDGAQKLSLLRQNRITNGYWTMTLDVGDPQNLGGREILKGIFSVNGFHNGTEFFRTAAESLKTVDGQFLFYETGDQPPKVAKLTRIGDRVWDLGKLFITEGTNIIEIVITDYAGNESSKTFNIRGGRF